MTKEGAPTLGRPVILAAMAARRGSADLRDVVKTNPEAVDLRDARKADPEVADTKGVRKADPEVADPRDAPKADLVDTRDARIIVDPVIAGHPADLAGAVKARMNVHLGSVPNADRLNQRESKGKMTAPK
jgi:hypothetical protein